MVQNCSPSSEDFKNKMLSICGKFFVPYLFSYKHILSANAEQNCASVLTLF